jgi:hypothetical protein
VKNPAPAWSSQMFFVAMADNQRAIHIGFACAAAGIVG